MSAEAKLIVGSKLEPVKFTPEQIARFWSRVDKTSHVGGCWIWTGYKNPSGYGRCNINRLAISCHRLSFALANGKLEMGPYVCHRCDNPSCVNPDHLFLGSIHDNNRDCDDKNRRPHGENHCCAKLTNEQAIQIRAMIANGRSCRSISIEYGTSSQAIVNLKNGKTWKKAR